MSPSSQWMTPRDSFRARRWAASVLSEEIGFETSGAKAVVVGRSMLVGKPMASCSCGAGRLETPRSQSPIRAPVILRGSRAADIVIAAIGRPHFLGANHIGNDAVVIDVGINRIEDPHSAKGYRIVGDVDFEAVAERCAAITPVPGGVGPMTIAMLMANTVTACERLASLNRAGESNLARSI